MPYIGCRYNGLMASAADENMTQLLDRGSTRLLVLAVLADGPRHGYAIQKRVAQATNRQLAPGTLYPLLKQLTSEGLIEPDAESEPDVEPGIVVGRTRSPRRRIVYRLTEPGRTDFKQHAAHWQAVIARLQGLVMPALRHIKNHPV